MMSINFSQPSQNSGSPIKAAPIFIVLLILIGAGIFVTEGIKVFRRVQEDRDTRHLCHRWARKVLAEAKADPPEIGTYVATLPVTDIWEQPLTSVLVVQDLSNIATVHSYGRDMRVSDDDYASVEIDHHVRKSILKGIVAGSHSVGKGLTSGIIEGLGEAKDVSLKKAKEGATRVEISLMSRFKKKEKSDENG